MTYKDLADKALQAFQAGIDYLMDHTIISLWLEGGKGWQERWNTAPYAGQYASCMGIVLLSKVTPDYARYSEARELMQNAYENLCCAMDPDVPVKDHREQEMRNINTNITLKSIKFLMASRCMPTDRRSKKVFDQCFAILKNAQDDDGGFFPAIRTKEESILTSHEALCHLKSSWLESGHASLPLNLKYFEDILGMPITANSDIDQKDRLLVALNVISNFINEYSPDVVKKAAFLFQAFMPYFGSEQKIENRFHAYGCSYDGDVFQDAYSTYKPTLIVDTLINFLDADQLPLLDLNRYLQDIAAWIERISQNGFYGNIKDLSFSVNYHVLSVIYKLQLFINSNMAVKEMQYMIVNPVQFHKQDFILDNNLVVAIMPFKPDWSKAVFAAFKEAVESKGMTIWRSDMDFRDDHIVQTIWEKLNQARFIIADCTGKNPNVFYELGIAHTIGKPVFLCSQRTKDYPFDIATIRHFDYQQHDFPKLKSNISAFITEMFKI